MLFPIFLYGLETWTLKKDENTAPEVRFPRAKLLTLLNVKLNADIEANLKTEFRKIL